MTSSKVNEVIPVEEMEKVRPARLAKYLGVSESEFSSLLAEAKRELTKVKTEEHQAAPKDRDAAWNTARWRYLLLPHQWTGYDQPEKKQTEDYVTGRFGYQPIAGTRPTGARHALRLTPYALCPFTLSKNLTS